MDNHSAFSPLARLLDGCVSQLPSHEESSVNPQTLLQEIKEKLNQLEQMMIGTGRVAQKPAERGPQYALRPRVHHPAIQRIIDGVFDGVSMLDAEGNKYSVPVNYASKSKLVEGDLMQLMLTPGGKMLYRQVERVERTMLQGYVMESNGEFACEANGRCYKISHASITYWRVQPGDRMTIIVPKNCESTWAAVETV